MQQYSIYVSHDSALT